MTNKIENIIHLMDADNDGNHLGAVNQITINKIVDQFGGCTVQSKLVGFWKNDEGKLFADSVTRVIVAFDSDNWAQIMGKEERAFRDIAEQYKAAARQECVYVVINGKVEFV